MLELEESDEKPHRASMKFYIDNKSFEPSKLETYNDKGEKVIEVKFSGFKKNTEIDKKIFEL